MKNSIFAAIDIGSYNCRLTIVKRFNTTLKIIHNFSYATNLIKNLSFNNEFSLKNTQKTVSCLKKIANKLIEFNVNHYRCIATEACRQVLNPEFFINLVKDKTNLHVEVISAHEEAQLSFNSCLSYTEKINEKGIIFDIGGGSTELTVFHNNFKYFKTRSISYGVINLSEKKELYGQKFVETDLRNHFNSIKNDFLNKSDLKLTSIGSCSTATTLCAIYKGLNYFDIKKIEGCSIKNNDFLKVANRLNLMSDDQLKKYSCVRSNYQLLQSGIKILKFILEILPIDKIITSQKGLRDGILIGMLKKHAKN